jgi:hypothetical protein
MKKTRGQKSRDTVSLKEDEFCYKGDTFRAVINCNAIYCIVDKFRRVNKCSAFKWT